MLLNKRKGFKDLKETIIMSFLGNVQGREIIWKDRVNLIKGALYKAERESKKFSGLDDFLGYVNELYKNDEVVFARYQLKSVLLTEEEFHDSWHTLAQKLLTLYEKPEQLSEELGKPIEISPRIA